MSAAAGSQPSEVHRKRELPRDVLRAALGSWREREWSGHPQGSLLKRGVVSLGRQEAGGPILARASLCPLEKPGQGAVELKLSCRGLPVTLAVLSFHQLQACWALLQARPQDTSCCWPPAAMATAALGPRSQGLGASVASLLGTSGLRWAGGRDPRSFPSFSLFHPGTLGSPAHSKKRSGPYWLLRAGL